jgi:hypothetical protein
VTIALRNDPSDSGSRLRRDIGEPVLSNPDANEDPHREAAS